ncbi:AAA family ATPase [Natronococcus occultus]|uniref:Adenylylsulfate kinase-like kinase n=1 Tax=Natronococcus occultus SP4 TaxID=694430 RepID=L0JW28_9EURY|nr:AAA family ATPase [Natronococcus occultus]AGB36289.1 adenylylsulfate kinase-like kinase [Natronococcus occultus SP4]
MIVALCGPPGAGKTTVSTRVADRLEARGESVRLVHSDEFSTRTYEQLYERVAEGPEDVVWLVDATFYRREWQDRFRTLGDVRFVLVTASLETCLERNRRREDAISEQGVHVVSREFDAPEADLELDTDELSATEATDRVLEAFERWRSA